MTNKEKYDDTFIQVFGIAQNDLVELVYQSISEWDSVGHMTLMATLEDNFNIALEMDDIIDFSSYEKGMEILKKYGIDL